jgi:diguanylate cyclase
MPILDFLLFLIVIGIILSLCAYFGLFNYFRSSPESTLPSTSTREINRSLQIVSQTTANVSDGVKLHSTQMDDSRKQITGLISGGGEPEDILTILDSMAVANKNLQQRLTRAEEDLKQGEVLLSKQHEESRTDALTRVLNRRGFDEQIASLHSSGSPLSLMLLDIDHFKSVNDTHGHDVGDTVLRETAKVITNSIRSSDVVARFGGEEFVVIMPHAELKAALHVAMQVRRAVESNNVDIGSKQIKVTASIGVTSRSNEDVNKMIKRADRAMYSAKKAGRNRTYYHNGTNCLPSEQITEQPSKLTQTDSLTDVLDRNSFEESLARGFRNTAADLSMTVYSIDNLDEIHNQHGEKFTDIVRCSIAQFFMKLVSETNHVARIGNGRFAVLIPGSQPQDAVLIAERVRRTTSGCELTLPNGTLKLTLSVGISHHLADEKYQSMLDRAEAAVEHAQAAGGNQTCVDHGFKNQSQFHSDFELLAPLATV